MKDTFSIPKDLQLVTDSDVTGLFPDKPVSWATSPKALACKITEEHDARALFFAREEAMPEEPYIAPPKCSWGRSRINRFVSRYVNICRRKKDANTELYLSQLEEIARENNVQLPTREDAIAARTSRQKNKLVSEVISDNEPNEVSLYRYYIDGSSVVAYKVGENKQVERELHEKTQWDTLFDELYRFYKAAYAKPKNKEEREKQDREIEYSLINEFYNNYLYDDKAEAETCPEFISRKIYNRAAAYGQRMTRFRRKKDQVRWSGWWTLTYDDEKFGSEPEFRRRLLNFFRNMSFRRGWRIMGVFEHGSENGRLHFHGFFYFPKGSEIGELVKKTHWSEKRGRQEEYIENTKMRELFGVNSYEKIEYGAKDHIDAMATYTTKMLKYMEKGEKVFYSRHIPTEFEGHCNSQDMLMFFNICCRRPVKRYIVNPRFVTVTDLTVHVSDPFNPVDTGLMDCCT